MIAIRLEEKNEEDESAIGVYQNDFQKETLVGHMPRNISKFAYKFLNVTNWKLYCKVKGKKIKQRCWIWFGNTCNLHV